jgi:hypothetical protein
MDFILGELSTSVAEREALWEVAKREAMLDETEMQSAQKQLKFLLAGGSWPNMLARMTALLDKQAIKIHFIVVLKLNLEAARAHGWRNKEQVFEKLEKFVNEYRTKGPEAAAAEEAAKKLREEEEELAKAAAAGGGYGMHAPVFESTLELDTGAPGGGGGGGGGDDAGGGGNVVASGNPPSDDLASLILGASCPLDVTVTHKEGCIDGKMLGTLLTGAASGSGSAGGGGGGKRKGGGGGGGGAGGGGNKKKNKTGKKKSKVVVDLLAKSLSTNGWAVCDNFVPRDLVAKMRDEIERLQPHFEGSEIWVGKGTASVGAHLRVPSVRGDKVSVCG